MILEIQHETSMEYSQSVSEWLCELRMEPVSDATQRCHSFQISVGQPVNLSSYLDGFGNRVHHFNILKPPTTVRVLAASVVETEASGVGPIASQSLFSDRPPADEWQLPLEALDYLLLPGPVRAYLCLGPANEVAEFATLAALPTTEVRWIRGKLGVGEICVTIPSAARPAAVRAAKRAAARRHLARASGS